MLCPCLIASRQKVFGKLNDRGRSTGPSRWRRPYYEYQTLVRRDPRWTRRPIAFNLLDFSYLFVDERSAVRNASRNATVYGDFKDERGIALRDVPTL